MTEPDDPLEIELKAFHAKALSEEFYQRVAGRLAEKASPRKSVKFGWVALGTGLAAAVLAYIFVSLNRPPRTAEKSRIPVPAVSQTLEPEYQRSPSLRAYREAWAQSPDAFESLLERHGSRSQTSAVRSVTLRAFPPSDRPIQTLSGDL